MKSNIRFFRFGPFSLDAQERVLRRNGTRVNLQGQPYQILEVLLTRAGKLVTRDELRETLWPGDTYVDFEHGLNTSVKKLRLTLDSIHITCPGGGAAAEAARVVPELENQYPEYNNFGAISGVWHVYPPYTRADVESSYI